MKTGIQRHWNSAARIVLASISCLVFAIFLSTLLSADTTKSESPKASSSKAKDEVVEITFSEVNMNMTADMVFRPFLVTDRVRELEGKRVRITGQMFNLGASPKADNFLLLKNKECKFGPGGQADHLFNVVTKNGQKVKYRDEPLMVEGVFKLNPTSGEDGNTWSVFDLLDAVAK